MRPLLHGLSLTAASVLVAVVPAPAPSAAVQETARSTDAAQSAAWSQLSPDKSAPPATDNGQLAYDSHRERMVLFGGGDVFPLQDTWSWNGRRWRELQPDVSPPPRYFHAMAYDPVLDEVVLFGGDGGEGTKLRDTWAFAHGQWTQLTPATSPPAEYGMSMAFDPNLGQLVMFLGGRDFESHETWTFDGTTWTQLQPADSPSGRYSYELTYDPSRNALVLFGGVNDSGRLDGTWTWDGSNWNREVLRRSPPARNQYAMATFGKHVVMLGGFANSSADVPVDELWQLGRRSWKQLTLDPRPPGRAAAMFEWDAARGEAVLFGGAPDVYSGALRDTWFLRP